MGATQAQALAQALAVAQMVGFFGEVGVARDTVGAAAALTQPKGPGQLDYFCTGSAAPQADPSFIK
jgi:hypothetical protein